MQRHLRTTRRALGGRQQDTGNPLPAHRRRDRDRIEPRHRGARPEQHHGRPGETGPTSATITRAVFDASSRRRLARDSRSVAKTRCSSSIRASRSACRAVRTPIVTDFLGPDRIGCTRPGLTPSFLLVPAAFNRPTENLNRLNLPAGARDQWVSGRYGQRFRTALVQSKRGIHASDARHCGYHGPHLRQRRLLKFILVTEFQVPRD